MDNAEEILKEILETDFAKRRFLPGEYEDMPLKEHILKAMEQYKISSSESSIITKLKKENDKLNKLVDWWTDNSSKWKESFEKKEEELEFMGEIKQSEKKYQDEIVKLEEELKVAKGNLNMIIEMDERNHKIEIAEKDKEISELKKNLASLLRELKD